MATASSAIKKTIEAPQELAKNVETPLKRIKKPKKCQIWITTTFLYTYSSALLFTIYLYITSLESALLVRTIFTSYISSIALFVLSDL